jgi:hypothetical protein
MNRTYPKLPASSAKRVARQIIAERPATAYVVTDLGGVVNLVLRLASAGIGGAVEHWPITIHGESYICCFIVLYSNAKGRWRFYPCSRPTRLRNS